MRTAIYTVAATLVTSMIVFVALSSGTEVRSENTELESRKVEIVEPVKPKIIDNIQHVKLSTIDESEVVEKVEIEAKPQRPRFKTEIPLDDEFLDFLFELSNKNNISYELMVAMIEVESTYDEDAISYDGSSVGLMQISKRNKKWLSELAGIEKADLTNPKHNVLLGVEHIKYTDEYWTEKGFSEEDKFWLNVVSYNRGIAGTKKWIRDNGWENGYFDKVFEVKTRLEQDVIY